MKRASGFALPIVIILSALASSILAYDLHRLQGQADLAKTQLLKGQLELLAESQKQSFVTWLHQQLEAIGCLEGNHQDCQLSSLQTTTSLIFQDHPLNLTIRFTECRSLSAGQNIECAGAEEQGMLGVLELASDIQVNGIDVLWQRYSYISTQLIGSPLVRQL